MPFSETVNNLVIDGYAVVSIATGGGALTNIGLVNEVKAQAKAIVKETTKGSPSIGYDLIITGKLQQTTPTDWAAMVNARQIDKITVNGASNNCSISNAYMKTELDMDFSNKPGSFISFEVTRPGQTPAAAIAFMTAAT